MRIAIIGDGAWGTALALTLSDNGHDVVMWGPFEEQLQAMEADRENRKFLPGVTLAESMTFTADRSVALENASMAVLAVPSRYFRAVMESFKGLFTDDCALVSVAKGFDEGTHMRMTEVAEQVLGSAQLRAVNFN